MISLGAKAASVINTKSDDDVATVPAQFERRSAVDWKLLFAFVGLSLFGLVMIASASMPFAAKNYGDPFHFVIRQCVFTGMGLFLALIIFNVPTRQLERYGPLLLICSLILLALVFVPGIGKSVNGSRRWLVLGPLNIQVSEAVKLFIIIYLAGYLVRRVEMVRSSLKGFLMPMLLICIADFLLLFEPDFGAAVIITATAIVMLFVAGVKWRQFLTLLVALLPVSYTHLTLPTTPYV